MLKLLATLCLLLLLSAGVSQAVQTKCRPSSTGGASPPSPSADTSLSSPSSGSQPPASGSHSHSSHEQASSGSNAGSWPAVGSQEQPSSQSQPAENADSAAAASQSQPLTDANSQPAGTSSSDSAVDPAQSGSQPPPASSSSPGTSSSSPAAPANGDQGGSQPSSSSSAASSQPADTNGSQALSAGSTSDTPPSSSSSSSASAPAGSYKLDDNWSGSSFFNGWDFFDGADPTHGTVQYLSQSDATAQNLAYVTPSGQAVMRADNTTTGNRKSVRISTQKTYDGGLFVLDLAHFPTGVGTWPAWWTFGPNWPNSGEIDILEGVSTSPTNQYTLHTGNQNGGCTMPTGDCYGNQGCDVVDSRPQTFGDALNQAGGGVFAMLWSPQSIQMWYFGRDSIPADLTSDQPNPSSWTSAAATFPNSDTCNISNNFKKHQMIINLTFCGDWAGAVVPDCVNQVTNNPSQYSEAYWLINSVKTYQQAT